ncbi:MAG: type I-E CRISPR-associated endoribonuclease Cas2e [Dehalococcoidia bacterium]|nr:type I-E CRISPR-associated endoribonuclease Cas2e [Dehalococcoidia bacterium]
MMVLILERVPRSLRGELSKWVIEPRAGVFVGNVSALVRDKLWEKACQDSAGGSALLLYRTNNEQGYAFRLWGSPSYHPEEFEGLLLVRRPSD